MRTIYKYQLRVVDGLQEITTHIGAHIVHVGQQNGYVCVWMEVDTSLPEQKRHFEIIGTGQPIPFDRLYVGTVMLPPFVWHVYSGD